MSKQVRMDDEAYDAVKRHCAKTGDEIGDTFGRAIRTGWHLKGVPKRRRKARGQNDTSRGKVRVLPLADGSYSCIVGVTTVKSFDPGERGKRAAYAWLAVMVTKKGYTA